MIPLKWFPIHLHYLPVGLADIECVGAVICAEWKPVLIRSYYDWEGAWPIAPGDRLMAFLRNWPELSLGTACQSLKHVLFSIEGESDLGGLYRLEEMKSLKLSCIQIFHKMETVYFHPNHGLTNEGHALLREMERLDFVLDLSHLSGPRLDHVLASYDGRRIVSHVVCLDELPWSLVSRANAMSDRELRACCAELYGVPFIDDLISAHPCLRCSERNIGIKDIVNHIVRLADVVGIERVALGPDYFDYEILAAQGVEVGPVSNLDQRRGLEILWEELCRRGLSELEVSGIFWRNAARVFPATTMTGGL